jgi:ABC-type dipeptide/oligopeptide/nickel transport system permease subunit
MMGLVIVVLLVIAALTSIVLGIINPDLPIRQNLDLALKPPSAAHWFGTDHVGRDVLMRVLFGSQISIVVGFTAVAVGMSLGMILGVTAGYFGGWWDWAVMRMVDVLLALPFFLLAIAIAGALGPGLANTVLAL